MLKAFPECGLNCLVEAVTTESNCTLTDSACVCPNQAIQAAANVCVLKSCTIPESLTTEKLTKSLCGITSEHDETYTIIIYLFISIASVLTALRFFARLAKRNPLWWDDWSVLVSTLIALAFTVICGTYNGLGVGLDLWAVDQDNLQTILILL